MIETAKNILSMSDDEFECIAKDTIKRMTGDEIELSFSSFREEPIQLNRFFTNVEIIDRNSKYKELKCVTPFRFYFDDLLISNFLNNCDLKERYNEKKIYQTMNTIITEILKDIFSNSNEFDFKFNVIEKVKISRGGYRTLITDNGFIFGRFGINTFKI